LGFAEISTAGFTGGSTFVRGCNPNQRMPTDKATPATRIASTDLDMEFFMQKPKPQKVQALKKRPQSANLVQKFRT
jgi:hypothetical protein